MTDSQNPQPPENNDGVPESGVRQLQRYILIGSLLVLAAEVLLGFSSLTHSGSDFENNAFAHFRAAGYAMLVLMVNNFWVALSSSRVSGRAGTVTQAKNPVLYWVLVLFQLALIAFMAINVVRM